MTDVEVNVYSLLSRLNNEKQNKTILSFSPHKKVRGLPYYNRHSQLLRDQPEEWIEQEIHT